MSDEPLPHARPRREKGEELDIGILRSDIGFQIHITRRAIGQSLRGRRKKKSGEPSGYLSSLILIGANPGISQREIADALFLDPPNLASMLNQMVETGLIWRTQDETDRRRFALRLTKAGEKTLASVNEASKAQAHQIAGGLTEAEAKQLVQLLGKVQMSLRDGETS